MLRWWLAALVAGARNVDIAQNLRARLADDSQRLGNVAEGLLSVQSDVNRVEKESLGKVFDLQTLRTFFAAHQRMESENDALKTHTGQLEAQLSTLQAAKDGDAAALAAQVAATEAANARHAAAVQANSELTARVKELEANVDQLGKQLGNAGNLEAQLTEMQKANQALDAKSATQAAAIAELNKQNTMQQKEAEAAAKMATAKIVTITATQKALEDQLVMQHSYGVECHNKLSEAQTKLASLGAAALDTAHLQTIEQALAAERGVTSQLKAKTEMLMQEVTQKDLELSQTKFQTSKEFMKLKSSIGTLQTHATGLEQTLNKANVEKTKAETEVQELKKALLAASTAELEHRVSVLESEVQHSADALKNSQVSEARARSEAQQAVAYQHAAEETAKLNAEAAQKAAEIAREEVAAGAAKTLAAQNAANEAKASAEAALAEQCEPVWEQKNEDCVQEKELHAQSKAKVLTLEAQVQLLSQSCQDR